ncbi:FkbM family methyltransferase [Clostridium saccharobutylicum]|uniref:Methyltransferase FkbM domain-containing protein n=1 Tax=Clostridium saccharobutylicum TaxID=169679 RepID=A0A1S8NIR6_CLOSA|nr:FkbM family methyltransferase [Clostridium saccharobutylicum]OOM16263.1 hypothetical protein CLOSAC_05340 [Clostridium saccharobutylicum]
MIEIENLIEVLEKFEKGTLENYESQLKHLETKDIMLYGAGNIGKKLYSTLNESCINVKCFLDKNQKINLTNYKIPVYYPEDEVLNSLKENGYVILSALFSKNVCKEIKSYLMNLGFKNVYALHEINFSAINKGEFYENLYNGRQSKIDINGEDKDKIMQAFSLLENEDDEDLYINYVKAHLTMDFTRFNEPNDVSLQYLAHDIPIKVDYSNFIDCGGFDGDTVRNLIHNKIKINNLAIFEPQNDLCEKIYDYTKQNNQNFETVTILPCGVGSKFEKLKLSTSSDSPSTAKVSESGNDIIQCVAIDEVLQGFKPTFIKMDIEGAETEALKGAKNTIVENHPQLAICVYHSLSDIWEIPLLIKSFYSGYKFYLRSYNYMGLETVLYAFPDK